MDKYFKIVRETLGQKDIPSVELRRAYEKCFQELNQETWNDTDITTFCSIYNTPLKYNDIGLEINQYHTFRQIIENGSNIGIELVICCFRYKRAQNLYQYLLDILFVADSKRPNIGILSMLKATFKEFVNRYEKDILENYYQYYNNQANYIMEQRS